MDSRTVVGVVGLGNMGGGLAATFVAGGYSVLGFDPRPDARDRAARDGISTTAFLDPLLAETSLVVSSLPGPAEVAQTAERVVACARPGSAWVECSTADVETGLAAHRACRAAGIAMLDAPLTGGAEGARAGTVTMLVGGEAHDIDELEPYLAIASGQRRRMGPPGSGYAAKLCQLHLNYLYICGLAEMLALARKTGVDLEELSRALGRSCAQSYVVDRHMPQLLRDDEDGSFSLGLACKDLRLIAGLAQSADVDMQLAGLVRRRYEAAIAAIGSDAPHLSVARAMFPD